jgi:hypothetical protein
MMTTSGTPPWPPRTEQELQDAANNGLLVESHKLDLKRELGSKNVKTAADLAAFAVDGGTIIVGVDEGPPVTLAPFVLKGIRERIEQIGLSAVDEVVHVSTYDIPCAADATRGYVVVEIPVSGRAPHMADGRYYARGDSQNIVLSDAEVMRWHERKLQERNNLREEARCELQALADAAIGNTPINLLIIAEPLGARRDVLLALSSTPDYRKDVASLLHSASLSNSGIPSSYLHSPTQIERHPEGILAVAEMTNANQTAWANRSELIFHEETGRLALRSGGIIEHVPGSSPARRCLRDTRILGHTEILTRLTGIIGNGYGYSGSWQFAIALNNLGRTTSCLFNNTMTLDDPPVYKAATYDQSTVASLQEITKAPQAVVWALTSKLLRGLGTEGQWPWLVS